MHFNIGSLIPWVSPLLLGLGVALGHLLGGRIVTPSDHDKAVILEKIADGAAALVLSLNPKGQWNDLLKAVISAIEAAAGLPTSDAATIERAAAAALSKLGKSA